VLLTALALLLVSLLVWGGHFLTPGPAGGMRRLLERWPASRALDEVSPPAIAEETAQPPDDPAAAPKSSAPNPPEAPPPEAGPREPGNPAPAGRALSSLAAKAHYALDLGTFATDEDAERAEARLNQAGFATVRFRRQAPARLFTVSVRPLANHEEPPAAVPPSPPARLSRAAGGGGDDAGSVRVALALPLRSAVQLAERLRSAGYHVRIAAEAAKADQITLRHGNFASREEAEAISREISHLGVPNEVVQVR
jgi:cell division protein FtsN